MPQLQQALSIRRRHRYRRAVTVPTVGPEPPDALLEDTQAFWREAGKALIRGSLSTLDETAKQLIAVSGILIPAFRRWSDRLDTRRRRFEFEEFVFLGTRHRRACI